MNMNKTIRDFIYETFMHGSPPLDFHKSFMEFLEDTHPSLTDTVRFTFQNMDCAPYVISPAIQDKEQAIVTMFDQCELFNKRISYVEYKGGYVEYKGDGRWQYDVVVVYLSESRRDLVKLHISSKPSGIIE